MAEDQVLQEEQVTEKVTQEPNAFEASAVEDTNMSTIEEHSMAKAAPVLTISEVLNCLEQGMTRTTSQNGYNARYGSIQQHFNLTVAQVNKLFEHPELKGRRTKTPTELPFELVNDVAGTNRSQIEE